MPAESHLLSVGRTGRAHGLKGEVVVKLTTNRLERVAPGAVLHAGDRPLVVLASRPHDRSHVVRFEGVDDRTAAEAVANTELHAEPLDDPDELWVHELLGAVVVDQDGVERGVIEAVEANPASDLLVLDTGALVPVRFVVGADAGRVTVEVPDGLFELT